MTGFEGDPQPFPTGPGPSQPPPRARIPSRPMIGALLCLAAAVLAVVGSFAILISVEHRYGDQVFWFRTTSWTGWQNNPGGEGERVLEGATPNGIPLIVAAVMLVAGAGLGGWAARRAATGRAARAGGPVTAVGAAFLAGTVGTIGMQVLGTLSIEQEDQTTPDYPRLDVTVGIGAGFWIMVASAGLAIVATLFAWRPARAGDVREEPETPRLGIPVVTRLPDAPPSNP